LISSFFSFRNPFSHFFSFILKKKKGRREKEWKEKTEKLKEKGNKRM
jgi:hypothetical protein